MRGKWEIQRPCQEDASQFDAAGFCQHCQQTVHDLSRLTRSQAAELYYENGGKLCVRLTCDAKGEVEFRPDPPSVLGGWIRSSLVGISMAASPAALAQEVVPGQCAVEIRVTDQSGGTIPNARVILSSQDPGRFFETSGKTNEYGVYRGEVPLGNVGARVEVTGFVSWTKAVSCIGEQPSKVEAVLQIGSVGGGVYIDPVPSPIRRLQYGVKRLFRRG